VASASSIVEGRFCGSIRKNEIVVLEKACTRRGGVGFRIGLETEHTANPEISGWQQLI
jgi:hypothetical protein